MKRLFVLILLSIILISGCTPDSCESYCKSEGYGTGECFDCVYLTHVVLPQECKSDNFFYDKSTNKICTGLNEIPEDNTGHGCLCGEQKAVGCTLEAKVCPDGSAVGRTGPDCEFAPCPETEGQEPEEPKETKAECSINTDCVPAECCHAKECVPRSQAPNCKGMMCTMECAPGTMDCGQGSCQCINNGCKAIITG